MDDADRELLQRAVSALREFSLAAITVRPRLDEPYPDNPRLTPWTLWIEPRARNAHDLSMEIRKRLKETG